MTGSLAPLRQRLAALLLTALAASGLATLAGAAPAVAASSACDVPGVDTFAAPSGDWSTASNWTGGVPTTGDDVCIPQGSTVEINQDAMTNGVHVHLNSFEVASGAVLRMGPSAEIYADGTSPASAVRSGGVIDMYGAVLGGQGTINVTGTVNWNNDTHFPPPNDFAPRFTTRACAVSASCPSTAPSRPGLMSVKPGGRLVVGRHGVNLSDSYTVSVDGGTMQLLDRGFVSAAASTLIQLTTVAGQRGTLQISNDGGIYRGSQNGLSRLVNQGRILRDTTAGDAVIYADYTNSNGAGVVAVDSGRLLINGNDAVGAPARVGPGAGYGPGQCVGQQTDLCTPTVDVAHPQAALFVVPVGNAGRALATVQKGPRDARFLARPIELGATHVTQPTVPAAFQMTFDASKVPVKDAQTIAVFRDTRQLKDCENHAVPAGAMACLDRQSSTGGANTDLTVVIRVLPTTAGVIKPSRWYAR